MKRLSQHILEKCANFRTGIVLPFQEVPPTFSDIPGVYNIAVPEDAASDWRSASGSLNFDRDRAVCGAIGEAIERYCGALSGYPLKGFAELGGLPVILPEEFSLFSDSQYRNPGFAWKKPASAKMFFGQVYSLYDNCEYWIPQEMIGLGIREGEAAIPSTSTGLAAHHDKYTALLLALQEVLERDALAVFWLNSLGGRQIDLARQYLDPVVEKQGNVFCFDITQEWNPHPVVIVCGYIPQRGKKRISMGVACRRNYREAIEKAYLEWIQGCIFAGYYSSFHPDLKLEKNDEVVDFDAHAVYYTVHPDLWEKIPIIKNKFSYEIDIDREDKKTESSEKIIEALLRKLKQAGLRIFYRDLSMADAKDVGLSVVRVVSPELALLHGDERQLFLGGSADNVAWRYPEFKPSQIEFPNKFPHPLG